MKQSYIKLPFLLPKAWQRPAPMPPIVGEKVIPKQTTVAQLAVLLGQKLPEILADVEQLGFFVTAEESPSFEIISAVVRKYGYVAKRAA